MTGSSDRLRITTTISASDKDYLDKIGVEYSSALALGVRAIKNEIGDDAPSAETKLARLSNVEKTPEKMPNHATLLKRSLSDDEIDKTIRRHKETLKRLGEIQ